MNTVPRVPGGTVHPLPSDLSQALTSHHQAYTAWRDITPLARNEWICWPGCVHRKRNGKD